MPTNKNASIRYQTLDKCFRDFSHRYYIDDLIAKCEEALLHYDTLLMQNPENYIVLFNKGYVNYVYLEDNQAALDYFNQTLAIKPDYLDAKYNKGRVLEQMGDYAQALEIYKEVLKTQPDYRLAIDAINRIQNQEIE